MRLERVTFYDPTRRQERYRSLVSKQLFAQTELYVDDIINLLKAHYDACMKPLRTKNIDTSGIIKILVIFRGRNYFAIASLETRGLIPPCYTFAELTGIKWI